MNLVEVAEKTLQIVKAGHYAADGVEHTIPQPSQWVVSVDQIAGAGKGACAKKEYPHVTIQRECCVQRCLANRGKKVCLLNFANAWTPGGGFIHGAKAQEEQICRCSNLYASLTDPAILEQYYVVNRKEKDFLTPRAIISETTIISDTEFNLVAPMKVTVMTCAAVCMALYLSEPKQVKLAMAAQRQQTQNVCKIIGSLGHFDVVILGAFGCGAFKNSPEGTAEEFKNAIQQGFMDCDSVEFAIKDRANTLAEVFERYLL